MDDNAQTAQVIFMPSGKKGRFAHGTPVLDCARALGVDIDSVCGGRGICGRCQVNVGTGNFAKHGIESSATHLEPVSEPEKLFDSRKGLAAGRRLSCHARLAGDILIDVPPESQIHKQLVRKRAETRAIEIDPVVRLHYVEVDQPDMAIASGDAQRLCAALQEQWHIAVKGINLDVLAALQATLRAGDWKVTVAIHGDGRIVRIWPGFHDRAYGIAVDIGSTTIAAHLCDLYSGEVVAATGIMNPQIRFGEDLMSRVSYAMMNEGGAGEMTDAVRGAVDDLFIEAIGNAGIDPADILTATFVGNPVMHHLFLGLNPEQLGFAPFALASDAAMEIEAGKLHLTCLHPGVRCYFLPCIAGHVGADTAAMILSEAPHLRDDMTLLVDVGTNAELVLGNRKRLLAASSPTGPAFEGAQISNGQRAAPGAIERVRIDPQTLEPRFRIIGCDLWSDDAAFADASKDLGITGICGSGIIEALAEMFLVGLLDRNGIIDGALAPRTNRLIAAGRTFSYLLHEGQPEIAITQTDIRAIQLAKGALYAGARLLMDELGISEPDRIVLAGAFGSH
ncbi:MAG: ASKHA domain-containing protein, partial [Fimbriimonadaceae bacterium]|nr:ASKHA domain-containing protein [Alphaproteobacteria bacterium]